MSDAVTVDTRELQKLMRRIARVSKHNPGKIKKMFKKIGAIVQGASKAYAPRSPTKAEYVSTLKGGRTRRATSSFTTGNLKKSITVDVKNDRVEIGVPANSPAGKYAEKMHDEKGKTWNKLGKHNDGKATDKFIFKAYIDSEKEIESELGDLLDEIIKAI